MDKNRFQQLKDLVAQALDVDPALRRTFLAEKCGSDEELLAYAIQLLAHDFPETNDLTLTLHELPDLNGQTIGRYKIIEQIGEGGMGVVYLASQSAPLRRQVAVKVIKVGMDTKEVIARFESERQALAVMDHPNIATVYDAGATAEGRPYFVMEHIKGVPLNRYCADKGLGLRERLDLFLQVCRGVQHAHQKGIIHRDLKPGNILVTEIEGEPVPKIIDFGVSKAMASPLSGQTLFTQLGQMIGTPEYMSPEQAGSALADVDTRSDVYSLGVLLYELLTGTLPLTRRDILEAGLNQMAQLVQNEIPKKPSTRLDTEAKRSSHHPTKDTHLWVKRVRGDLDWITMKALEKDRERRYGSAADLATDLVRHLESRAVSAGPPSGAYRLGKFVRRNRAGVGLAVGLLCAVVGFATWQTIQSRIIARERDKAMANERLSLARGEIEKDPTVAVAYALASLEILDQPGARDAVRQAIAHAPIRNDLPRWGQRGNPISVDASPDGRHCVVSWTRSKHPTVGIYSLEDYSMRVFRGPTEGEVWIALFNSDGSHVTAIGRDGGVHVWRVADGEYVLHLPSVAVENNYSIYRLANPRKMAICTNIAGESTLWFELDIHDGTLTELGRSRGVVQDQTSHNPAINPAATWVLDYEETRIFLQGIDDLGTDRATLVGQHEAPISSLAIDASGETAASVDAGGQIKVWDLVSRPPQLIRKFKEVPGTWILEFDPFGRRFFSSNGSETVRVYDLTEAPNRRPVPMLVQTAWAHDGTFLPDRSLVTTVNGGICSVYHWKSRFPVAWTLDRGEWSGTYPFTAFSQDGKVLYLWNTEGEVTGIPLVDGISEGVGSLGWTPGWVRGIWASLKADRERNRCLTYSLFSGTQVLDLTTGKAEALPGFEHKHLLWELSKSGRYAGFVEFPDWYGFYVYDLEAMQIAARVNLGSQDYRAFCLTADNTLLAHGGGHVVRFDFTNPDAPPDTLWRKEAIRGGLFLEDGRSLVELDAERRLVWVDLTGGSTVELGTTTGPGMNSADYNPGLGLLAVAGWWNSIEVFDVENGTKWRLPVPGDDTMTLSVHFDPNGRWLISTHPGQIIAWSLPLDPLFGDLAYDEMLETLRALTNVRVVPDETQPNGFRVANTTDPES